ncbi:MAG: FTR1 family protein [Cyanobacteriota bacterium]|jgi:high-affinity iron transporter
MDLSSSLPVFLVTLREGFEAALVIGIVFAYLQKAGQTRLNRWVYQGIAGGVVASVMVGFLLAGILQGVSTSPSPYAPVLKQLLAALFGLLAIGLLSWMLIWMTRQARNLKSQVEADIAEALAREQAGRLVALAVFIAVLQEGFETVLFIAAQVQSGWQGPILGALAGVMGAALLGYLLFNVGLKINLRRFFQVLGVLLLLVIGGLLIGTLKNLNGAVETLAALIPAYRSWCWTPRDSCLLGPLVWDGANFLPDSKFPGIILKALLGYRQTLYFGQVVAYGLFWLIVGGLYFAQARETQKMSA